MNKERLLELASDLRAGRMPLWRGHCTHFDMGRLFEVPFQWNEKRELEPNFCSTMCCIAGMAVLKYEAIPENEQGATGLSKLAERAKRILDLDEETAKKLFFPAWLNAENSFETGDREEAARVIERLVETGEVSWGEEKDEEEEYDDN